MSGLALLAALTIFTFILIWANIMILEGTYLNYASEAESVFERIKLEERVSKESYTLSIVEKDSYSISARIENTGLTLLPVNTFTRCDLIIYFYDLSIGSYSSYWLPYNSGNVTGSWYVSAVYTGVRLGEDINPFNLTASNGHLDPGESMHIVATIPQGSVLDVNHTSAMLFAAPTGAKAVGVG